MKKSVSLLFFGVMLSAEMTLLVALGGTGILMVVTFAQLCIIAMHSGPAAVEVHN